MTLLCSAGRYRSRSEDGPARSGPCAAMVASPPRSSARRLAPSVARPKATRFPRRLGARVSGPSRSARRDNKEWLRQELIRYNRSAGTSRRE